MDASGKQDQLFYSATLDTKGQDNIAFNEAESTESPHNGTAKKNGHSSANQTVENVEMGDTYVASSPNGHVVDANKECQDLVIEKKEFDHRNSSLCSRAIMRAQEGLIKGVQLHKNIIMSIVGAVFLLLYFAYFGYAMYYRFGDEGSIRLLVCTIIGVVMMVYNLVIAKRLGFCTIPLDHFLSSTDHKKVRKIIRWALYISSAVAMVTVLIVVVALDEPRNLLSLAGLAAFIFICFITSYSPAMVNWHPVYMGFVVQFFFALIILKTRWGFETFNWLGDRVTEFLAYSNAGAAFVFGDYAKIVSFDGQVIEFTGVYTLHFFAFSIMPVVTFFSTVIAVLYYLGIMQAIIKVIGRFLSFWMGTTPAESISVAANIFVSMTEAPLMIRPFLPKMTSSELHTVMVGGFATIAGSVLGAYIGFGVPADHLLSASVLSAPAALAISKLLYPEIEVPVVKPEDYDKMEKTGESNVIEAACNGANISAKIIAAIIVNVMAFLSLLKFVNATLTWFGDRVGVQNLTFELICSYVLYPIALFMGTEPEDCRKMAELVGLKTFTNEFIAYEKLSELIKNRKIYLDYVGRHAQNYSSYVDGDDLVLGDGTRLLNGIMSQRSQIIATYALCGFSNIGSMGILLGSMSAMAPQRKSTMSKIVLRAMIAGNIACFFTACIAGLFFQEFK